MYAKRASCGSSQRADIYSRDRCQRRHDHKGSGLVTGRSVCVASASGNTAVVRATVAELHDMRRTALQWSGPNGFELHALEFGADYGTPGHIWAGATSEYAAIGLDHGFVTQLGTADVAQPMLAEVYTYPVAQGPIDLRLETEISATNCGMDVEVQAIEFDQDTLRTQDLLLSIPDCSVMGDLLVLSGLLGNDLIASR